MRLRLGILVVGLLIVADLPNRVQGDENKQKPAKAVKKVWAGISVNQAIFRQEELEDQGALLIKFALVNDGDKTAATDVDSWRIIVNGKQMSERNTSLMFGNGSRMEDTLPPGGHSQVAKAMGVYFKNPGTYKVSWKGKTFESSEITFRVLPREKK
jgi:archaellum component FlaG (FlaF/FlaG flagellin family)